METSLDYEVEETHKYLATGMSSSQVTMLGTEFLIRQSHQRQFT